MSDDDRCEFVRTHLPQVVAAAQASLRGNAGATTVVIGSGQLGADADRRKSGKAAESLPHGERRRGQRRNGDRRRSSKRTDG